MRLVLDAHVTCADGARAGTLRDVVVDPQTQRVTHLVVVPGHEARPARLVPLGLATVEKQGREVRLSCTGAELEAMETPQDFLRPRGEEPEEPAPGWDVGIEYELPYAAYSATSFGDFVGDLETTGSITFDRIPKGTVELRRDSVVEYADGRVAGSLHALELDGDEITHVVYEHGHLWRHRRVAAPVTEVREIATDTIFLRPEALRS